MKIIQLKCPSCGAALKVSDNLKSFTCNFCGNTSLLDDEIIRVEHTIKNQADEEVYKRIDGCLKLGYVEDAAATVNYLITYKAYDAKTWLYAIKVYTNDYDENVYFDYDEIKGFLEKYETLEEDEAKRKRNVKKVNDFFKKVLTFRDEDESLINHYLNDNEEVVETMVCPFCSEKIEYGQNKCKSCGNELYWPNASTFDTKENE